MFSLFLVPASLFKTLFVFHFLSSLLFILIFTHLSFFLVCFSPGPSLSLCIYCNSLLGSTSIAQYLLIFSPFLRCHITFSKHKLPPLHFPLPLSFSSSPFAFFLCSCLPLPHCSSPSSWLLLPAAPALIVLLWSFTPHPVSLPPNTCPHSPLTPTLFFVPFQFSPSSCLTLSSQALSPISTSAHAVLCPLSPVLSCLCLPLFPPSSSSSPPPPSQLPCLARCLPRLLSHLACVVWEGSPASSPSLRSMPWPLTFWCCTTGNALNTYDMAAHTDCQDWQH